MSKVRIPLQDVPVVDPSTGIINKDWYDALKKIETLGLLDMADVPTTIPTNGQKPTWNTATLKWTWV
jgi:hypothetical protein